MRVRGWALSRDTVLRCAGPAAMTRRCDRGFRRPLTAPAVRQLDVPAAYSSMYPPCGSRLITPDSTPCETTPALREHPALKTPEDKGTGPGG
jgi:hypothetical protein